MLPHFAFALITIAALHLFRPSAACRCFFAAAMPPPCHFRYRLFRRHAAAADADDAEVITSYAIASPRCRLPPQAVQLLHAMRLRMDQHGITSERIGVHKADAAAAPLPRRYD